MGVDVGGVPQSPEGQEVWAARGKGNNIPIRRGSKLNTEMGTDKRYRN